MSGSYRPVGSRRHCALRRRLFHVPKGALSKLCLGGGVHSSQIHTRSGRYVAAMPWGLKRFQQSRQLHFLTFSCYHREAKLGDPISRATFETSLERVRQQYGFLVYGYVVMPEHVHLLVSEPERGTLAQAMQSLKQSVARTASAASCRSLLASSLLRLQRVERTQVRREAAVHPSESVAAWLGRPPGRLGLEQFPPLREW